MFYYFLGLTMKIIFNLAVLLIFVQLLPAQDKAEYQTKFVWDGDTEFLAADFSKISKPKLEDFKRVFAFEPTHQDTTGTCWAFSATSFLESEIYRLQNKKVRLSEIYYAYCDYIEKARRFVQEKGDSYFAEGSESNAVLRNIDKYGMMPLSAYSGLLEGQDRHNHESMFNEMNDYLQYIEEFDYWDEEIALANIKQIMNKYIGMPPTKFEFEGKTYTPASFRDDVCKIKTKDYVGFMSTMKYPFYEKALFEAPDNWWFSEDYHNVPLDDFYNSVKMAIENGYSMVIGGDVSEPGKYGWEDIAIVVPWDIPAKYINQSSRELRIYNSTTEDDHGIHLLGIAKHKGDYWFLIKDSGSSSRYGTYSGYYFFREDFIKLKMLTFLIHKDAVKEILGKF